MEDIKYYQRGPASVELAEKIRSLERSSNLSVLLMEISITDVTQSSVLRPQKDCVALKTPFHSPKSFAKMEEHYRLEVN